MQFKTIQFLEISKPIFSFFSRRQWKVSFFGLLVATVQKANCDHNHLILEQLK